MADEIEETQRRILGEVEEALAEVHRGLSPAPLGAQDLHRLAAAHEQMLVRCGARVVPGSCRMINSGPGEVTIVVRAQMSRLVLDDDLVRKIRGAL